MFESVQSKENILLENFVENPDKNQLILFSEEIIKSGEKYGLRFGFFQKEENGVKTIVGVFWPSTVLHSKMAILINKSLGYKLYFARTMIFNFNNFLDGNIVGFDEKDGILDIMISYMNRGLSDEDLEEGFYLDKYN